MQVVAAPSAATLLRLARLNLSSRSDLTMPLRHPTKSCTFCTFGKTSNEQHYDEATQVRVLVQREIPYSSSQRQLDGEGERESARRAFSSRAVLGRAGDAVGSAFVAQTRAHHVLGKHATNAAATCDGESSCGSSARSIHSLPTVFLRRRQTPSPSVHIEGNPPDASDSPAPSASSLPQIAVSSKLERFKPGSTSFPAPRKSASRSRDNSGDVASLLQVQGSAAKPRAVVSS